jgi:hypothetical protein
VLALVAALGLGCPPPPPPPDPNTAEVAEESRTIAQLRREVIALQKALVDARNEKEALARLNEEVEELKAQVARLEREKARILEARKLADKEFVVTKVALGVLTSSIDTDGNPGDDGLQVYLYLLDQSGDPIKRAGSARLELYDLSRESRIIIDQWELGPDELAKCWSQFLSVYSVRLKWHGPCPSGGHYVLRGVFIDRHGREFKSFREIEITPPPIAKQG